MTGNTGRPGPDIRRLADLDAGLLDEATAREVRAAAEADPAARAVLDALTATRAELAALPDPPVPPALAARWSAALAAEQSRRPPDNATEAAVGPDRVVDTAVDPAVAPTSHPERPLRTPSTPCEETETVRSPAPPPDSSIATSGRARGTRRFPQRARGAARLLRRPAVLAAALLVAVAVVAGLRARAEPPPTVGRPQLVAEALSAVGVRDTGGLDDPVRRTGCLRAVGAPVDSPDAPLLGGRRVTFEGEPGVLLVLGTGLRGTFDVLIVDPDCGPSGGRLLAATRVTPP
jgi:hypothetical protein